MEYFVGSAFGDRELKDIGNITTISALNNGGNVKPHCHRY